MLVDPQQSSQYHCMVFELLVDPFSLATVTHSFHLRRLLRVALSLLYNRWWTVFLVLYVLIGWGLFSFFDRESFVILKTRCRVVKVFL